MKDDKDELLLWEYFNSMNEVVKLAYANRKCKKEKEHIEGTVPILCLYMYYNPTFL